MPILVWPAFTLLDLDQSHIDSLAPICSIDDSFPETDLQHCDRCPWVWRRDRDLEWDLCTVRDSDLRQRDLVLDLVIWSADRPSATLEASSCLCRVFPKYRDGKSDGR